MVILWTNLEGEKVEPSPTAQRPASEHGGRSNNGGQLSLKRRVQVALKPSLPSLFLPLVKPNNNSSSDSSNNGRVVTYSPGPTTDSVSLPSSLDSSPTLADDDPLRLVVIRLGDLSPDSGVVIQFEPTPSPSVAFDPVRPTTLPAQRAQPPKTLPIIYGKTQCQSCKKKCSGEVLRVQDKYFHIACFKCRVCQTSLAQGGFFCKDGEYYCTRDYQDRFGTKCSHCGRFVEGEVVTALGKTYHSSCFTCARCRQPFPSGERVTFTGKEVLCPKCVQIPVMTATPSPPMKPARSSPTPSSPASNGGANTPSSTTQCTGCSKEIVEGQALIALDSQWHVWCFKCVTCNTLLHGEYMGKDGLPYCEKDYQRQFGVKCDHCERFIAGKVLQAGDNHHFHPTCARCSKCGDPFGDGEEMFLQGSAIWHPRCGPGPGQNTNGNITLYLNGANQSQGHDDKDDRFSSTAGSEFQFSMRSRTPSVNGSVCPSPYGSMHKKLSSARTLSPGLILRDYGKRSPAPPEDITRLYTYSYLTEEPTMGYLRKPIDPYDRPPKSPHFHRPQIGGLSNKRSSLPYRLNHNKPGMKALLDQMERETPRPKSPHMNNEEPIELAHFPNADRPRPGDPPRIERDDFPAPPYPYTDPERRRRWSESSKRISVSDVNDYDDRKYERRDVVDGENDEHTPDDPKIKKSEAELSKIATGIGKVFLHNLKEREKFRQWKMSHLDPRNASRTPSANKEPPLRLRYESPINASPSRFKDHPRPFDYEEPELDRQSTHRSSLGRSIGTLPTYNVVSALRYVPKPGYGFAPTTRSHTFTGDYALGGGLAEQSQHTDFGSNKSDISAVSLTESDRRALAPDLRSSNTYSSHLGGGGVSSNTPRPHSQQGFRPMLMPVTTTSSHALPPQSAPFRAHTHLRRSLPNMSAAALAAQQALSNEPPKIYPAHLLFTTNYRLPVDVDRCQLERHLSDTEFEAIFQMTRSDFYRIPPWKRNEIKKRFRLF
ncbi:actin-binding LIM protein 1-like isoform X2 [Daphnia pulicaria]|uniref:actin-binding LIM protein 1-like isoform X2 n=1 Tax=Daphnia pulicaria TaxID=35523 RepID=UPI001EE9C6F2|nr:actin-binding LIM protein 1-like isoform X2 [Daphnia pulicaria]